MFKINNKDTKKDFNDIILAYSLLPVNLFHIFFSASIVDFERVNVSWV